MQVDDGRLTKTVTSHFVAVDVGASRDEIAVAGTTPSKIEMKVVVVVISVANESVSARFGIAGIVDRTERIQLCT